MSTPLFGGGSSHGRHDLFSSPAAPHSSSHHHHGMLGGVLGGIGGFGANLLGDVRDAAVGLPAGLVHLAEHPIQGFEQMGKTTWMDWSPLFHGHPLQFAKQTYAHPLAPILDVASVVTGGAGLVAKGGEGLAAVGAISKESKLAQLGKAKDITLDGAQGEVYRHLHGNPVVRARQELVHGLGEKLAQSAPSWFGRRVEEQGTKEVITKGRIRDLSPEGQYERAVAHRKGTRAMAADSLKAGVYAQVTRVLEGGKKVTEDPQAVLKVAEDTMATNLYRHPIILRTEHVDRKITKVERGPRLDSQGNPLVVKRPDKVVSVETTMRPEDHPDFLGHHPTTKKPVYRNGQEPDLRTGTATQRVEQEPLAPRGFREPVTQVQAPEGMRLLYKSAKNSAPFVRTADDFETSLAGFADRYSTSGSVRLEDVARDAHGNFLAVDDHTVRAMVDEAVSSSRLMKALYDKPTRIWKWMILATRPAFFLNNAVGNTLMTMAHLNPFVFSRAMIHAIRDVHGESVAADSAIQLDKAAMKSIRNIDRLGGRGSRVLDKWYLGPHQEGYGYEASKSLSLHEALRTRGYSRRVVSATKVAEQGLYSITQRVAEKGLRGVGITALLRSSPEVRALMKEGGGFWKAVDKASENPAFRARMQEGMDNILGQYHYFSPLEQHIRKIVPFYSWDRAITRHVVHLAGERPTTAALGAMTGQEGVRETEQLLGQIPTFMKGMLPVSLLGFGGKSGGRTGVLSTAGLNPYATFPDVTDAATALVSGHVKPSEAIGGQLNPIVAAAIQHLTGQSLLSGAKINSAPGGLVGDVAAQTFGNTQLVKLIETALGGEPQPKPNARTGKVTNFLYRKDARTQIAGLLGVPVKELNKARAHEMRRKELGLKKGRKHSHHSGTDAPLF